MLLDAVLDGGIASIVSFLSMDGGAANNGDAAIALDGDCAIRDAAAAVIDAD